MLEIENKTPPTPDDVVGAENVLGRPLPEPYRSWLLVTGGGYVNDLEMPAPGGAGVLQELFDPSQLAMNYGAGFAEAVPAAYVVVGDGAGGAVCLQLVGDGSGSVHWADYDLGLQTLADGESSEEIMSALAPDWDAFLAAF